MTVSKEWLDTEIAERSKEPHRTMYSRTLLDALKELASLRAADEGAVTVEGWVYEDGGGSYTLTTVDMSGAVGWRPSKLTIRKAKP